MKKTNEGYHHETTGFRFYFLTFDMGRFVYVRFITRKLKLLWII